MKNDIWIDAKGDLKVYNGEEWVAYADVPDQPVRPNVVYRGD